MQVHGRFWLLQLTGILLAAFTQLGFSQVELFDCYTECGFNIASQPGASCEQLESALTCYYSNIASCGTDLSVDTVLIPVTIAFEACTNTNTDTIDDTPTPVVVPTPIECPNTQVTLPFFPDPTVNLGTADITPEPHSCAAEPPDSLRHCSMFTYSHLRPFKGYRTGLETCTVPGEWYLLKHPSVSVVVESEAVPEFNHTRLSKVNVTFSGSECSDRKSYVATSYSPLSVSFADGTTPNNSNSPLQLKASSEGGAAVVSLLAVWLNTKVIIRKFSDSLSVTLQVPGELSFQSEGLCLGCPRHAYFNVSASNQHIRSNCVAANDATTLNCFIHPLITNVNEFDGISNDTYADYCIFDTYKTESNYTLSVFKAIGEDAKMLKDKGTVPIRIVSPPPTLPTVSMTTNVIQTTVTTIRESSTVPTDPQTTTADVLINAIGSAPATCPLNLLLNVSGLLIVQLVLSLL